MHLRTLDLDHFGTPHFRQEDVPGVLDTGASLVVLPLLLSQRLGLNRIARRDVQTPSGTHRAWIYDALVTIPELAVTHEVEVASIIAPMGNDIEGQPPVLLGKGLLQHFHFCMLGPERRYTLAVPEPV
jgi:predicted aspartyl protease